ncbi:hypothetical protein XM38_004700 [Halomicronema hongdechloris C2206]|uniref:Ssl1498 family light-harvesting-like protein n=1 Tax=Halomicronema hongdechloris C2206 TaxID=1641165 RepID=A0A1Z3HH00_9CYAN|nr:ssl1498 family light-harvesting-like protein [Halomicronema hongdechloris]ASC69543.1 hypothetical protein XM38_004700 [Halomicronema hongdechloris C2206]
MPYTTEDGGRLNNFAHEPKMYQTQPPTTKDKRNYAILGLLAVALVAGLLTLTVAIS